MKYVLIATLVVLPGCGNLGETGDDKQCYFSPGDEQGFYFILDEQDTPYPSLTIQGPNGEDPVTVYGTFEDDSFIYPDGHRLFFNATRAWGEEGSLIEGIEAAKVSCP